MGEGLLHRLEGVSVHASLVVEAGAVAGTGVGNGGHARCCEVLHHFVRQVLRVRRQDRASAEQHLLHLQGLGPQAESLPALLEKGLERAHHGGDVTGSAHERAQHASQQVAVHDKGVRGLELLLESGDTGLHNLDLPSQRAQGGRHNIVGSVEHVVVHLAHSPGQASRRLGSEEDLAEWAGGIGQVGDVVHEVGCVGGELLQVEEGAVELAGLLAHAQRSLGSLKHVVHAVERLLHLVAEVDDDIEGVAEDAQEGDVGHLPSDALDRVEEPQLVADAVCHLQQLALQTLKDGQPHLRQVASVGLVQHNVQHLLLCGRNLADEVHQVRADGVVEVRQQRPCELVRRPHGLGRQGHEGLVVRLPREVKQDATLGELHAAHEHTLQLHETPHHLAHGAHTFVQLLHDRVQLLVRGGGGVVHVGQRVHDACSGVAQPRAQGSAADATQDVSWHIFHLLLHALHRGQHDEQGVQALTVNGGEGSGQGVSGRHQVGHVAGHVGHGENVLEVVGSSEAGVKELHGTVAVGLDGAFHAQEHVDGLHRPRHRVGRQHTQDIHGLHGQGVHNDSTTSSKVGLQATRHVMGANDGPAHFLQLRGGLRKGLKGRLAVCQGVQDAQQLSELPYKGVHGGQWYRAEGQRGVQGEQHVVGVVGGCGRDRWDLLDAGKVHICPVAHEAMQGGGPHRSAVGVELLGSGLPPSGRALELLPPQQLLGDGGALVQEGVDEAPQLDVASEQAHDGQAVVQDVHEGLDVVLEDLEDLAQRDLLGAQGVVQGAGNEAHCLGDVVSHELVDLIQEVGRHEGRVRETRLEGSLGPEEVEGPGKEVHRHLGLVVDVQLKQPAEHANAQEGLVGQVCVRDGAQRGRAKAVLPLVGAAQADVQQREGGQLAPGGEGIHVPLQRRLQRPWEGDGDAAQQGDEPGLQLGVHSTVVHALLAAALEVPTGA